MSRKDPEGPNSGEHRILRGGAWGYLTGSCRVACRYPVDPGGRYGDDGFPVVCSVPKTP